METNEYKSEEIKFALAEKAAEIDPSEQLFSRIKQNIAEEEWDKKMFSKVFSFKKAKVSVAILTCCVLLLGSTAVIGATIARNWMGYTTPHYTTFPSEETIIKDVGFAPKYLEILPGGFEYSKGGTGESQLTDEAGGVLTQTKEVSLTYTRGTEESALTLTVSQLEKEFLDNSASSLVDNYNGLNLYYYEQDYKFVPEDYELTEEDKKANETGELEISYGTAEVSCVNVQVLSWYEEGLEYSIMGSDHNFTTEEMVEIAKAIIEAK